jgi:signal transduction histidine kinase
MANAHPSLMQSWRALEHELKSGVYPAADAFGHTYDLLTRLMHQDLAAGGAELHALPARCAAWPHAAAIKLAVLVATADPVIWKGDSEGRMQVWRQGAATLPEMQAPALTSLYLALMVGHLFNVGHIVEALSLYEQAIAAMQLGAHEGAEIRLRIHAACATSLLGQYEESIKLSLRAEAALLQHGRHRWHVRVTNLGMLCYSIFHVERERILDTGVHSADRCQEAMGYAHLALDLIRTGDDNRMGFVQVSILHTAARLRLLMSDVDGASGCFEQIDAVLAKEPAVVSFAPRVAAGRALLLTAQGLPMQALAVLDDARDKLLAVRADAPALDWWQVRSEVLVALGRWQEAHEAQGQYIATRRVLARERAELLHTIAERRLDHFNAAAMQFLFHDLHAPLHSIVAVAQAAAEDGGSPETLRRLASLARRASHIAGRSVDCMRVLLAEQTDFKRLDLSYVLDDACEDTEALGAHKGVRLVRDLNGPAWVLGDQDLLRRAFANVLSNAIRFAPDQSEVVVRLHHDTPSTWQVGVLDTGPGFGPETVTRLQASALAQAGGAAGVRSLSASPAVDDHPQAHNDGHGHGLGLSFVSRAMSKHDATLRILNNQPHGAHVLLQFNEEPASPQNADARAQPARGVPSRRTHTFNVTAGESAEVASSSL